MWLLDISDIHPETSSSTDQMKNGDKKNEKSFLEPHLCLLGWSTDDDKGEEHEAVVYCFVDPFIPPESQDDADRAKADECSKTMNTCGFIHVKTCDHPVVIEKGGDCGLICVDLPGDIRRIIITCIFQGYSNFP